MGLQFYQPNSEFREGSLEASYVAYATANLPFFAGSWLAQFSSCSALAVLWPGEKLAAIIKMLQSLHKQNNECRGLIAAYENIYSQLTLSDFTSNNNDIYIYIYITPQPPRAEMEPGAFCRLLSETQQVGTINLIITFKNVER